MKYIMAWAIICPNCGDKIFSRARHDMRYCTCKHVAVDGGFDYMKISFKKEPPERKRVRVYATKDELYDDWRLQKDKFGIIKKK
jgi:Zn-finger nucleic acid-binding protein